MGDGWRTASVTFFVAIAPGRDYREVITDLLDEIERGVQQTRVDYTDIRIKEVTSVNDPEAEQVAADQDPAAEASQDDDQAEPEQAEHDANPF